MTSYLLGRGLIRPLCSCGDDCLIDFRPQYRCRIELAREAAANIRREQEFRTAEPRTNLWPAIIVLALIVAVGWFVLTHVPQVALCKARSITPNLYLAMVAL